MTDAITIDVVVPVWNRIDETRNCLVNLINNTPRARVIMYDSGSDRETERLLQDFADRLEERALLMYDDSNIGFVRAANRGLQRAEAPFIALVRSSTVVPEGWLDPLLEFATAHPEAGILLPCQAPAAEECRWPTELSAGSFAAMVVTRNAYQAIGGFDEGLDGDIWCLRDYSRRAGANGFVTCRVPGPPVAVQEEQPLGSERRRRQTVERSIALFRERWGEGAHYVVHVPKGVELDHLKVKLDWMVKGARRGDSYIVLLPALLFKAAEQEGLASLHEHVRLAPLPRFALDATRRHLYERVRSQHPDIIEVTAVDGIAFPWSQTYLSFTELTERIQAAIPGQKGEVSEFEQVQEE